MIILKHQEQLINEALTKHIDKIYPSKEALENILKSGKKLTIYWGIDPTSSHIHLAHATNLFVLRRLQNLGHRIIVLIGDFTAQIGDPSGRDKGRGILNEEDVKKNLKNYKKMVLKILNSQKTTFTFNSGWWGKMSAADLLALGDLVTHQQIIEREMFQKRIALKNPISMREMQYPLIQGYDSIALKTDIEIGGTDQLFNMLMGRELEKVLLKKEKFVITTPLLENPDTGRKIMSKSEGRYISMDDKPADMFGKVMALPDEVILVCFKLLTDLNERHLKEIELRIKTGKNPRDIKSELAHEIVKIYHGEEKAKEAESEFNRIFKKREMPKHVPEMVLDKGNYNIVDLLVKLNLASSKSQARRLVIEKAVKIDGKTINDPKANINIISNLVVQVGKRHFKKIKVKKTIVSE